MNYKKIGLLGVVISVLLNGYFLKDYFLKKSENIVRVSFECKLKDVVGDKVKKHVETFRFKDNKVYSTYQSDDFTYIELLKDCVIIDNQNWSCGGKLTTANGVAISNSYVLNNGKFIYKDGYRYKEKATICGTKQLG
jgi:hypothetical protein